MLLTVTRGGVYILPKSAEDLAPAIARWLAPYVAQELRNSHEFHERVAVGRVEPTSADVDDLYDSKTCEVFVRKLGTKVVVNSKAFFDALTKNGEIGSLELAAAINVPTPRHIPAVLTTPLKRRATALGLPKPWEEGSSEDDRTVWLAVDDVASRMGVAIEDELRRRNGGESQ